jgi:hypothetical protein
MDVEIGEISSTVEYVDDETLLSPQVLARIVAAVLANLDAQRRRRHDVQADVAVRSVVDRQRAGREW